MPTRFRDRIFQDNEAEKAVIGSILIDNSSINSIADKLKSDHFYSGIHGKIWTAILDLYEKREPIDLITMSGYSDNARAPGYLAGCMNSVPTMANAEFYADRVINQARLRNLTVAAGRIASVAYEEKNHDTAFDRARSILLDATDTGREDRLISPATQAEMLKTFFHEKRQGTVGVASGFHRLDELTQGGFKPGDLVIVAGRTSTGKSTFAENLAERVAKRGSGVLFVSLEMSPEQLMYRFAVRNGGLSDSAREYGPETVEDKEEVDNLAAQRAGLPMYLLDMPSATPLSIRAAVNRVMIQTPVDLVVIDYLQIMGGAYSDKEHLRIGEITKTLKQMAREFRISVVLLSQLNRNLELRGGEPKLADLRDSGKIEEDADIVILLWKTEKPDVFDNFTKVKVEKNRNGPIGHLPMQFDQSSFTFTE